MITDEEIAAAKGRVWRVIYSKMKKTESDGVPVISVEHPKTAENKDFEQKTTSQNRV